jgi:hypothetical protein
MVNFGEAQAVGGARDPATGCNSCNRTPLRPPLRPVTGCNSCNSAHRHLPVISPELLRRLGIRPGDDIDTHIGDTDKDVDDHTGDAEHKLTEEDMAGTVATCSSSHSCAPSHSCSPLRSCASDKALLGSFLLFYCTHPLIPSPCLKPSAHPLHRGPALNSSSVTRGSALTSSTPAPCSPTRRPGLGRPTEPKPRTHSKRVRGRSPHQSGASKASCSAPSGSCTEFVHRVRVSSVSEALCPAPSLDLTHTEESEMRGGKRERGRGMGEREWEGGRAVGERRRGEGREWRGEGREGGRDRLGAFHGQDCERECARVTVSLRNHSVWYAGGKGGVLWVEDPLDASYNVAQKVTERGLIRLQCEMARGLILIQSSLNSTLD